MKSGRLVQTLKQFFGKIHVTIFNPIFISLVATVLVIFLLPFNFLKYKLTIVDGQRNNKDNKQLTIYDDLDNDGTSDLIFTYNNFVGTAAIGVYFYPKGNVEEWDLYGKFEFKGINYIFTGDFNYDEKKEIYAFTLSHDTVYLNCIWDFSKLKPGISDIFVSTVGQVNGKSDPCIISPQMDDQDGDGFKEIIFGIASGFSIYPRAIFSYNIEKNILLRSCETGHYSGHFLLSDINHDKKKEIIIGGYAPKNITDKIVAFHDSSNWGMVFDQQLKLIFPPKEFPGRTGGTIPFEFPSVNGIPRVFLLWHPPTTDRNGIMLYQLTPENKTIFIKQFSDFDRFEPGNRINQIGEPFLFRQKKDNVLVLPVSDEGFFLYNSSFQLIRKIPVQNQISDTRQLDIDMDGQEEIIIFDTFNNQLVVFRNDFKDPVAIDFILDSPEYFKVSLNKVKGSNPFIFISSVEHRCLLSYRKNPMYYSRWGAYGLIYLGILLFAFLIRKIQRVQLEKKYATEKKITELQMKIVRNQMDPHFTMNAINAVVDAISREKKEEARDNLLHFSKMYRSLVLSADKIKRSLHEELDFTENYLALEKFRFGNSFTYKIEVDPEVDKTWEVPKMVIQSPVENAVKHGLLKREPGGELFIRVYLNDNKLVLEITDNGIGREGSLKSEKSSTGKGIQIMEQFYELYYKITNIRVHSHITDLFDENGKPAGTKVIVWIPVTIG